MKKNKTQKPRPKKRKKRPSRTRRTLKLICLVTVLLTASLAGYLFYLSTEIDKRFSGRRWSIPSKVFSDTTILYPGQEIHKVSLEKKLRNLGYRNVNYKPREKGEIRFLKNTWELFLNDLQVPHTNRKGFPLLLTFKGNHIHSILNLQTQKPIPLFELEPELLMLFFGPEREQRRLISIKEIPGHTIQAVLAAEDNRFYEHFGMDPLSILRALYVNLRHGDIRQGGSTITQQLAKNYFLVPERTFTRKIKEVFLAVTMEFTLAKDEIIEIYLNEIYLGQKGSISINGIGEASRFYFGKHPGRLTLDEGAVLAGLIRAPNLYSPYADKERCTLRRNTVLKAMNKLGWISQEQMAKAISKPVRPSGYESYRKQAPYFVDYVSSQLSSLYPAEALSSLGLSIYTTLDTEVQRAAEAALVRGLKRLGPFDAGQEPNTKPQGALLVIQPKTGYILAMVGGREYGESQFNRLTQARRQPGSAFKPFVFLTGLDHFTPATRFSNEAKTYRIEGKPWNPKNYSPIPDKEVTMRTALAKSINLATVDLAIKAGLDRVVETALSFGFSSRFTPSPSLALGSFEVIPLELACAYCAFAADGSLPQPLSVKDVMDEKGKSMERRYMTVRKVTTPAKAFIMTSMLQSAVLEGTGRGLKALGIDFPVAGKTGTTNDLKDAWFVGYTPELLTLVWVGFDHAKPLPGSASDVALPIWADLMKEVKQHLSGGWFVMPPGVVGKEICIESGQLALPSKCPQRRREFFLEENAPKEYCTLHADYDPMERLIKGVKNLIRNF
ncbi:MAG: PBP1A family penicillin-binding protein [Deltaproteobacteria bacterium]|nr:PBP1A family penicillin-binding protein [Deltaproteobacteria bacterium]